MASAVLASRNEAQWGEANVYMRKYTSNPNPTAHSHSQLNTRFNPNPNFSRQVQHFSAVCHLRHGNETTPPASNANAVNDGNDLYRRESVTFNLASYSRRELKDLKKRLVSDLDRVRGLLNRIESHEFTSRKCVQRPTLDKKLPPNASVGEESKRKNLCGQKRAHVLKRPVVVEDKVLASMMSKCRQMLTKLMKHKHGWVFNTPVDAKTLGLDDYYDIIKHPMDLGTVKLRLDRNEYTTPQEFAADVRLTFNNAMIYNPKGQDVHALAEFLLGSFEDMFKPASKKYEAQYQKVRQVTTPNALPGPLPVAKKPAPVRPHSTLLNQHQFQVEALSAPVSAPPPPPTVPTAVKSVLTPRPTKLPKPKAKDPNKREMTLEEKAKLGFNLQNLPPEKMDQMVQIVKKRNANLEQDGDEIELDFEALDNETLWELDRFVSYHKKAMSKMKRQGITDAGQLNKSPEKVPEHAIERNKKGDIVEEDVDIGEEIPVESFPPVQIEKDAPCLSGSTSSRSGSDSSSSDSDSGSSSGSDSDEDSVQSPYLEAKRSK